VIVQKIILNALGINDSGGVSVLNKTLREFIGDHSRMLYIIIFMNQFTVKIIRRFECNNNMLFICHSQKLLLSRIFYENIIIPIMVKKYNINIIYNFSGTSQFLCREIQLVKIQNLLFYSHELDKYYFYNKQYYQWLKKIFFKRLIFMHMIRLSKYIEVQSGHVLTNISRFVNIKSKECFVKSDVYFDGIVVKPPQLYDSTKTYTILYIVGPHYKLLNKNISDFNLAMKKLKSHGINSRIKVTLTKEQMESCDSWDTSLNSRTQFLGYLSRRDVESQFKENTILVSTSVVETLGLHVIEGILSGIIVIVPDVTYSKCVYGYNNFTYKLFDPNTLVAQISRVIATPQSELHEKILKTQLFLIEQEKGKIEKVSEIFDSLQGEYSKRYDQTRKEFLH